MNSGAAPTANQAAHAHAAISNAVRQAGLTFAKAPPQADYLVTAMFTPDSPDDSRGHLDRA